jgi:hypothetical protein
MGFSSAHGVFLELTFDPFYVNMIIPTTENQMSDLVIRLRHKAELGIPDFSNSKILDEAADRIEALEAALRKTITECEFVISDAHYALAPEQDK